MLIIIRLLEEAFREKAPGEVEVPVVCQNPL